MTEDTCEAPGSPEVAEVPPPTRRSLSGRLVHSLWESFRTLCVWAVVVVCILVFTPAGSWLGGSLAHEDDLAKADYIVVLGGAGDRAAEAARLYHAGWAPRVIVSSTAAGAEELAATVRALGVPDEAVIVDGKAQRTAGHPQTLADLPGLNVRQGRLIIVTGIFHTSRARACFVKAGYADIRMRAPEWDWPQRRDGYPDSAAARAGNLFDQLYEVAAWGYYFVHDWV